MNSIVTTLGSAALVALVSGALVPVAAAQSGGGFELTWSTADAGGRAHAGGTFSLVGTAGQADTGGASGGVLAHDAGFAPGVCGGTIQSYGTGCAGTGGFVPSLSMRGCPATGYDLAVDIQGGLGPSTAFLFLGFGQAALPMGGGCTLNVFPLFPGTVGPLPLIGGGPGTGTFTLAATIPYDVPALVLPLTVQAFVSDPTGPSGGGFSNTNGVQLVFG